MRFKGGQQFENAPTGSHIARCYAVIDLGTNQHTFEGHTRSNRDVRISFELPFTKMAGKYNPDNKGKPFSVHTTCTQSLGPKARLKRFLEGWRGKRFETKEEMDRFDPKKLVGLACRLSLIENGDYVNIDAISPITKEEAKKMPKLINAPVFLSLEPDEFSREDFEALHESVREKIMQTPEWAKLNEAQGSAEEPQADAPEGEPGGEPEVDDVPF